MGSGSTFHVLEVCKACQRTNVVPLARVCASGACVHCRAAAVSVPYLGVIATEIDREQRPILTALTNALRIKDKAKRKGRLLELQAEHGFAEIASSMDYYLEWLATRRDARVRALLPEIAQHVAEAIADEIAELPRTPRRWPVAIDFERVGAQRAELLFAGEGTVLRFDDGTGQILAPLEWLHTSSGPAPMSDGRWAAAIEFAGGARATVQLDGEAAEWLVTAAWHASELRRQDLVVEQGRAKRNERRAAVDAGEVLGAGVWFGAVGALAALGGMNATAHYHGRVMTAEAELHWLAHVWWQSPWAAALAYFRGARATGGLPWPIPFTPLPQHVLALEPTRLRLVIDATTSGGTDTAPAVLTTTSDNVVIESQKPGRFWNCIEAAVFLAMPRQQLSDERWLLTLFDTKTGQHLGEPQRLMLSATDVHALFEQWDRSAPSEDKIDPGASRFYPSTYADFIDVPPPPPDDPIFSAPVGAEPDLRSLAAPRPQTTKKALAPTLRSKLSKEIRNRRD